MIRSAFEGLLDAVPAAYLLVSPDGRVQAANHRARLLLPRLTPGAPLWQLTTEVEAAVRSWLEAAIATSDPIPGSFHFLQNGDPQRLRCDGARVHDARDPSPYILLRLTPTEAAASRFLELNREIEGLHQEMAARAAAERALRTSEQRARFLADASAVLGSTLDVDATLRNIAKLAVPAIADWAAVDLREGDQVRRVAVQHVDPAKVEFALQIQQRYPEDRSSPHGLWAVLNTGRTQWMAEIPESLLEQATRDAEHLRLIRELQLRSYIVAPLSTRGHVFGAISFIFAESGRRYTEADVTLTEDLAHRAAVAIDNAMLLRSTEQARVQIASQHEQLERQNEDLQNLAAELEAQALELEHQLETVRDLNQTVEEARHDAEVTERYVRSILEGITDPLVVHDSSWRFRYVNAAAVSFLRSTGHDQLIGKTLWDEYPHLVDHVIGHEMRRAVTEGTTLTFEVLGDLTGQWTEIRCYPLPDGGLASVWKDISARKRAELLAAVLADVSRTLAASLDYHATLSALADVIVPAFADWYAVDIVEPDGAINRVITRAISPERQAWGEDVQDLVTPQLHDDSGIGRVIRTGQSEFLPELTPAMIEALAPTPQHRDVWLALGMRSAIIVPLVVRDRTLGALTFLLTDSPRRYATEDLTAALEIGARAGLAIENARLFEQAQQASRAKTEFLAVMSHELRTPLNAIIGYADLLAGGVSGPLNETQGQQLGRINSAASQLLQLIDQILSLSRIEAGKDQLHIEALDAAELAREAASLMVPAARQRNLQLQVQVPDQPVHVSTDARRVRQILLNLLSNAVKFTEDGSITLDLRAEPAHVIFHVRDTGSGIEAGDHERIFEPFVQVDSTATRRHGGSGLGLAVSRQLAANLGGSLTISSTPGQGSTFTLSLPIDGPQTA